MSDWQPSALSDIGDIFDGPHATPSRQDVGPYFLNIASLSEGRLDLSLSDHVTQNDYAKWTRRVTPREGDLLFSYETRLGEAALMPPDVPACLGRRMALIRPRADHVNPRFLLYAYLSAQFQSTIERNTIHGATVDRIPLNRMGSWTIDLPPLSTQRAIAEVLGALDDKIAANLATASAANEVMRAEFATLDPTHRVEVASIATSPCDVADPRSIDPLTPYVGLEHIPRRFMWLTNTGSADEVSSGKTWFRAGDTLFGKLRPYFHKVSSAPHDGVCSTDILVVRSINPVLGSLLLAALSSDEVVASVTASSGGTKMPRTSWRDLAARTVPWPTGTETWRIAGRLAAVRSAALALLDENETLAATRDALLPQLMSGRLRVRDAESVVVEVGG